MSKHDILNWPEEKLRKHLAMTGRTLEDLKRDLGEFDLLADTQDKAQDIDVNDKFMEPIDFDIVND